MPTWYRTFGQSANPARTISLAPRVLCQVLKSKPNALRSDRPQLPAPYSFVDRRARYAQTFGGFYRRNELVPTKLNHGCAVYVSNEPKRETVETEHASSLCCASMPLLKIRHDES